MRRGLEGAVTLFVGDGLRAPAQKAAGGPMKSTAILTIPATFLSSRFNGLIGGVRMPADSGPTGVQGLPELCLRPDEWELLSYLRIVHNFGSCCVDQILTTISIAGWFVRPISWGQGCYLGNPAWL